MSGGWDLPRSTAFNCGNLCICGTRISCSFTSIAATDSFPVFLFLLSQQQLFATAYKKLSV